MASSSQQSVNVENYTYLNDEVDGGSLETAGQVEIETCYVGSPLPEYENESVHDQDDVEYEPPSDEEPLSDDELDAENQSLDVDGRIGFIRSPTNTVHNVDEAALRRHQKSVMKSEQMKEAWAKEYKEFKSKPIDLIKDGRFDVTRRFLEIIASNFYKLECVECSSKFYRLTDMINHYLYIHDLEAVIQCCNIQFSRRDRLYEHMARHFQPSAFQCKICDREFTRLLSLKYHTEIHLPVDERKVQCKECGKWYSHRSGLVEHMSSVHGPNPKTKKHPCPICDKRFFFPGKLRGHMDAAHADRNFLCSECGKCFATQTNLDWHIERHDPNGENKLECNYCGLVCKNKSSLRGHMAKHTAERFSCEQCGYSTYRKSSLKKHMIVRHTDLKLHTCEVCFKSFKLKNVLKVHMAQHTGEQKYTCEYCFKKFKASSNYYSHRKKLHGEQLKNKLASQQGECESGVQFTIEILSGQPNGSEEETEVDSKG